MELYYTGVIIAVSTFLIIGLFHPIVIKVEYHTGTRFWWVFLVAGIISVGAAFLVANVLYSALLGVLGASASWCILMFSTGAVNQPMPLVLLSVSI